VATDFCVVEEKLKILNAPLFPSVPEPNPVPPFFRIISILLASPPSSLLTVAIPPKPPFITMSPAFLLLLTPV
jgi:hypothetical protein